MKGSEKTQVTCLKAQKTLILSNFGPAMYDLVRSARLSGKCRDWQLSLSEDDALKIHLNIIGMPQHSSQKALALLAKVVGQI
ncbi:hypothetical protein CEUSTIGMA_g1965.t1 [Chlamydomonas eustigma]|uniref:Uncharacterized protein n=1 Tax=Chlamydomonas eustigma TaxID=1157962 RepID=A0A250WUT2_9CHLO|nr:hypothetical protein CEUSTIGMA_g1965.t1 [Chlamydomonas eustigma]|eukprot:GAX74516.1 hypothetical protein CEUSTIGMA_g1965.t1 [Chlamydomonas eustigma]